MIEMNIVGDELVLKMRGWDKIWALKSEVRAPLSDITDVRRAENLSWCPRALRCPGTCLPGVITAGSYWNRSGWSFWSIHNLQNAIIIESARGFYRRLIVEPENPDATLQWLRGKLSQKNYTGSRKISDQTSLCTTKSSVAIVSPK